MRIRTLALLLAAPVALALAGTHAAAASTSRPDACPMTGVRGRIIGAATDKGLAFVLENTSGTRCELAGYPSLALLDGGGNVVGQARPDALGGDGIPFVPGPGQSPSPTPPTSVMLPPGGRAWVWLRYVTTAHHGSHCSSIRALRVGVAHRRDSLRVPVSFRPCDEVGVTAFTPGP